MLTVAPAEYPVPVPAGATVMLVTGCPAGANVVVMSEMRAYVALVALPPEATGYVGSGMIG